MPRQPIENYFPPKAAKADTMPQRHLFMMGNGKPVQPSRCADFINQAVNSSLDFDAEMRAWFQVGFAAAVDMIARGTLDFTDSPNAVIEQAWRDVHNITLEPNKVTDIMKVIGE